MLVFMPFISSNFLTKYIGVVDIVSNIYYGILQISDIILALDLKDNDFSD